MQNRKYAILGGTLKHTMSPPIHARLFQLRGREFEYTIEEVEPESLSAQAPRLNSLSGYNVTIPHKIGIIPHLDRLDETARRYGAVNCVDNKNGVLTGYNTDVDGFLRSISALGARLGGQVLLIGCGGVGRMMAIEACRAGAELVISVIEKDLEVAQKAKSDILAQCPQSVITITTAEKILALGKRFDLLINACPVGMYPNTDACPVPDEVIGLCECVFDAVYNPRETLLMKKARSLGAVAMGGMAMLVWQAVSAHEIWDGDSYSDDEVLKIIEEMEALVERDFPL